MVKNLSERIQQRAKQKKAPKRAQNFAAFLSQKDQIKQSIADGWSLLQIWETLHQEGKIQTGYVAFSRHVNKTILKHDTAKRVAVTRESPGRVVSPSGEKSGGSTLDHLKSPVNQEDII